MGDNLTTDRFLSVGEIGQVGELDKNSLIIKEIKNNYKLKQVTRSFVLLMT